ncbi:MAG: DUF1553 domain-containing protein [Acidobacteriia bacterium]|nr:DUF1553 domain-containing protein [Terriglobia bacterium]
MDLAMPCRSRFGRWLVTIATSCLAVAAQGGDFQSTVLPIFEQRCSACHGEQPQGGLKLDTQRHVLEGGQSGAAVVPGYPDRSLLLAKVVSGQMPMGGEKLPESEIDAIRAWIDEIGRSDAAAAELQVTEADVLPIFQMRCQTCHGKRRQEGGLDLRSLASLMEGGESGAALVPGKPDDSLLLQRILRGEMPPPDMLFENHVKTPTDAEVALLRKWVADGALPSEHDEPIADRPLSGDELSHWAFQTPVRAEPPEVENPDRVRNPIDAFLLRKLEAKGLALSAEADRDTLLRRAYLDLTGVPPTLEQIRAHAQDSRPDAYERLVDQLLDSQEYGERWAQVWLDLAGYADSEGVIDEDRLRLHAWRYRDYVIRALNSDKPYDRFLTEQLAGDELLDHEGLQSVTQEHVDTLAATGFLRMTPDGTYGSATGSIAERFNVVADEIEVLSSAVMGVTVGCARCHDHKYDPLSQREYYSLGAVFQSALDPYDWLDPTERILEVGLASEKEAAEEANAPLEAEIKLLQSEFDALVTPFFERELERRLAEVPAELRESLRIAAHTPRNTRTAAQKRLASEHKDLLQIPNADGEWHQIAEAFPELKDTAGPVNTKIKELKATLIPPPKIRSVFDMGGDPSRTYLLQRGDAQAIGERVGPGVPRMLAAHTAPFKAVAPRKGTSGNRLAFARWLTDPRHPLTSRVMVNRIWLSHFGRGIVSTPSNFGLTGAAPSHPELLDWLATEFVREGWSIKAMHRLIMTSSTYRQTSAVAAEVAAADPENMLLSRMPLRRMDAEVLHDSILRATGRLDPTRFGRPVKVAKKENGEIVPEATDDGWRRAVYVLKKRRTPVTLLEVFDAPKPAPNCTERRESNVAPQALQMMNGEAAHEHARFLAGRLIDEHPNDRVSQVAEAYERILSRRPTAAESELAVKDLNSLDQHWLAHLDQTKHAGPRREAARWMALGSFAHALLNSAEFLYID